MSDSKGVPFRSLKIHPGAAPGDALPPAGRQDAGHQRFAEFYKRRPAPAAAPGSSPAHPNKPPPQGAPPPSARDAGAAADPAKRGDRSPQAAPHSSAESGHQAGAQASSAAAGAAAPVHSVAVADPQGHHAIKYVAKTITRFCNDDAVRTANNWQVSIVLRPDVLADTKLHLGISPHWLLLRFETHDHASRAVICRHQESLEEMLDEAVVPRRDISIWID
jgi:type III secretion control protein HpaP